MSLTLSDRFRVGTHVVYPPFKKGRYMEEFFFDYFQQNKSSFAETGFIYIPAFWTNFQIDEHFPKYKDALQQELDEAVKQFPETTKFFTVVQYDDAVRLTLPKNTLVFGACSGHIPLPLIYEDITQSLDNIPKVSFSDKPALASFVGSVTSPARHALYNFQKTSGAPWFINTCDWTNNVRQDRAILYADVSRQSKFVFAPRGYGRSSFRFFEVFKLGSIPIYIWDDVEWLPYKDELNYENFCISVHVNDIASLQGKLGSITEDTYNNMIENYKKVKEYFTLPGMSDYILEYLKKNSTLDIQSISYYKGQV